MKNGVLCAVIKTVCSLIQSFLWTVTEDIAAQYVIVTDVFLSKTFYFFFFGLSKKTLQYKTSLSQTHFCLKLFIFSSSNCHRRHCSTGLHCHRTMFVLNYLFPLLWTVNEDITAQYFIITEVFSLKPFFWFLGVSKKTLQHNTSLSQKYFVLNYLFPLL